MLLIFAALLDIPVYKSRIQSLHFLFSLYAAFKNSQVSLPFFFFFLWNLFNCYWQP